MLLLQERMRALERLEPTDLPRRGHLHRPPLPPEDPGAHFLPPPRQHERMNVERGGHRLHLHTTLPTEAHRGQLELGAVFLDFLRPCARHRHLPLLGGSVYKSEGGFPVSFKRMLGRGVGIRARIDRLATHLLRAADERRKVSAELPRDGKFSVPFVKLGQQVKPPLQAIAYQPASEWEQEGQQYQRTRDIPTPEHPKDCGTHCDNTENEAGKAE